METLLLAYRESSVEAERRGVAPGRIEAWPLRGVMALQLPTGKES